MRESSGDSILSLHSKTSSSTASSANGSADFLSGLPQPATDRDRCGSSSDAPVDDDGIFIILACGLRTRSSPTPGGGLGGLVPRPENTAFGWTHFRLFGFSRFSRAHTLGRVDNLFDPSWRYIDRLSAAVTTADRHSGRGEHFPVVDTAFASFVSMLSEGGTVSAEAPAAATAVAQHITYPTSTPQGADSSVITDRAAFIPSPPGDPGSWTAVPPSGRTSTWTRRQIATGAGAASLPVDYGFGPGGGLVQPDGVLTFRRESHSRDHLWSPLRLLLLPPHLPRR